MSGSGTPEEIVAIDAFNESLRAKEQWIFAGGLAAPVHANVIDNRNDSNLTTCKPQFDTKENYSGFWLIQANDHEAAKRLAHEGSKACHRRVEIRPLLG